MKLWMKTVWIVCALAIIVPIGAFAADTGTFPPVDDVWKTGPYATTRIRQTGPNGGYTIFCPKRLAPNGLQNPIVIWGNGAMTRVGFYPEYLPHFASHGFFVVAANASFVSGNQLIDGLDWIIEQAQDPSSDYYQKVDVNKVCVMGYSMGSLATFRVADDPIITTTIHISGGAAGNRSVQNLRNPAAFLCDEQFTAPNCQADFDVSPVPVFYGVFKGAGHIGTMVKPFSTRVAGAATGWLRWKLMEDESQKALFVGDDCTICNDDNWIVQQLDLE